MIVLRAKNVEYEVTYIDLANKPDWFLQISPHGKVPVLKVDDVPLFESSAIAEYLEEAVEPSLHPRDLIKRARNRAWTDYVATFAAGLSGTYYVRDDADKEKRAETARDRLDRLEEALNVERGVEGPYFNGSSLSLVDAAYAPFLQRFLFVEQWLQSGLLESFPLVSAWAKALMADPVVQGSVPENFEQEFAAGLQRRGFAVAELMSQPPAVSVA